MSRSAGESVSPVGGTRRLEVLEELFGDNTTSSAEEGILGNGVGFWELARLCRIPLGLRGLFDMGEKVAVHGGNSYQQ